MQEYARKPQKTSSDSISSSSGQPPVSEILQSCKDSTLQRISVNEEELLQAKTRDKSSERETLQRYTEHTHKDRSRYNALIQGVFDTPQRKGIEDEELLQGKFEHSSAASESTVQREVKPNNTGLSDNLKSGIENLSGYSLDDVKVHYNSDKPAQLSALAYAQGTDIHVAPGQEKHLSHEAWHVVQQKQGRVQPTVQMQGVSVNDNEGLEREADVMGMQALQRKFNDTIMLQSNKTIIDETVQCKLEGGLGGKSEEDFKKEIDNYLTLNILQKGVLWREITSSAKGYNGYENITSDVENKTISLHPYPFQSNPKFKEMIMSAHVSTDDNNIDLSVYGPTEVISNFYRGDNRKPLEIIGVDGNQGVGFSAFGQLTPAKARHLISSWINQTYLTRSDFTMKWKYPTQRANLAKNSIPCVATSLTDARLGENSYKIEIPTMKFITIEANKRIGYDGADINSSMILALQIDDNEVIFLNHIPPQYITNI